MALRNVGRNWNRTSVITLSMAIASALMTLTMALSTGYAKAADLPWRQMVGADILVYPNRFVFTGSTEATRAWQWRRLGPDVETDALFFHPALARGYLSPAEAPPPVFDLTALPAALTGAEGVASVQPARLLPAYAVLEDPTGAKFRVHVVLRGRSLPTDSRLGVAEAVTSGRYFPVDQPYAWLAIVNAHAGVDFPGKGKRLTLEVPLLRGFERDGSPVVDYAQSRSFSLLVYGKYELPLGRVPLEGIDPDYANSASRNPGPQTWPVYIDDPSVWVPSRIFDLIYEQVAGESLRYTAELGVTVEDMFQAKEVATRLAAALPDSLVLTVPQEVALSGIGYRARAMSFDPLAVAVTRSYHSRSTLSIDVKTQLSYLSFVVAGLLVVANMFILVTQRRREIGVLKAIGAASRDILVLFLTEALGYSLVGSVLGFGAIRLLTLVSLFASPVSLVQGTLLTLKAAGTVVGLTTGIGLVFGFLPAWEAARTPSATLLGDL